MKMLREMMVKQQQQMQALTANQAFEAAKQPTTTTPSKQENKRMRELSPEKGEAEKEMPSAAEDFVKLFDDDPDAWRDYVKLLLNKEASQKPQPHTVAKLSGEMESKKKELRRYLIYVKDMGFILSQMKYMEG